MHTKKVLAAGLAATMTGATLVAVTALPATAANVNLNVSLSQPAANTVTVNWRQPAKTDHVSEAYKIRIYSSGKKIWADTRGWKKSSVTVPGIASGSSISASVCAEIDGSKAGNCGDGGNLIVWGTIPVPAGTPAATGRDGSAAVSWTPPSNTGGVPMSHYVVKVQPVGGGAHYDAPATTGISQVISGLTPGKKYTFAVTGQNTRGYWAPWSARSNEVMVTGKATAPTRVSAKAGNAQATVTWGAPDNPGGQAITGYLIDWSTNGGVTSKRTSVGPVTSTTITGLANDQPVRFRVAAVNASGASAQSGWSSPVTPKFGSNATPGAPQSIAASSTSDSTIAVEWSTPAETGVPKVTGYEVAVAPAGTTNWKQVARTSESKKAYTFTGLAPGAYTVRVVAINRIGFGDPAYAAATVTRTGPAGKRSQTVSVTLPRKLKKSGKTRILKRSVKTNAGTNVKVKLKAKGGKKTARLVYGPNGRVFVQTFGKKGKKIKLILKAHGNAQYNGMKMIKIYKYR